MKKTKNRIKQTGEVFTPTALVNEILEKLPAEVWTNPNKTYLDSSCGNGQFLVEVIKKKSESSTIQQAISTTYGIDLMIDNVCDTIARLYIYTTYKEDPFNEHGFNDDITILNQTESEHPTFDWLLEHLEYTRIYNYKNNIITVKFARFTAPTGTGAYFECNGILWHTVVCANTLTFLKSDDNDFDEFNNTLIAIGGDMNKTVAETKQEIESILEKATSSLLDELDKITEVNTALNSKVDSLTIEVATLQSKLDQICQIVTG